MVFVGLRDQFRRNKLVARQLGHRLQDPFIPNAAAPKLPLDHGAALGDGPLLRRRDGPLLAAVPAPGKQGGEKSSTRSVVRIHQTSGASTPVGSRTVSPESLRGPASG